MVKNFFFLFIIIFLSNCSTNNSVKNITDIKFDNELSFEQFKKNAIEYGKLSDFPNLDK